MARVNIEVSVINKTLKTGSTFFEGSILIREHGNPDISYNWGCKEPFQKIPKVYFANGDEVVFVPEKPITEDYKKSLNNWQKALIFLLNDVYTAVLKLKYQRGNSSFLKENKEVDFPEEVLINLAS